MNLKLIAHIRRILARIAHVARRLHVRRGGRIILGDAALFVAAEGVAAQVRVRGVEGGAGSFGQFRCRLWGFVPGLVFVVVYVCVLWTGSEDGIKLIRGWGE